MPRYRAQAYMGPSIGTQTVEVDSASIGGATDQMKRIYGAQQIIGIHEVRQNRNNNTEHSASSGPGSLLLIALVASIFWAPWIFMAVGGTVGAWITTKFVGDDLDTLIENDETNKVLAIFIASLICGGIGIVKGTEFHKYVNTPDNQPKVEQPAKK